MYIHIIIATITFHLLALDAAKLEDCPNCNSYDDCLSSCTCFPTDSAAVTWNDAKNLCTNLAVISFGTPHCAIGYSYWAGYKYRCCYEWTCNGDASPPPPQNIIDDYNLLKINEFSQEINYLIHGVFFIIFMAIIICLYKFGRYLMNCRCYNEKRYSFVGKELMELNVDKEVIQEDEIENLH